VTLFEVDEDLNFHFYYLSYQVSGTYLNVKRMYHQQLSAYDFFNCNAANFTNVKEVKGIAYLKDTFYIFINYQYLRIKDDLVRSRFKMSSDHFKNVKNLDLKSWDPLDYRYENLASKYTKTLRNDVKLVVFDKVFDLQAERDNQLITEETVENNKLKECVKQTLSVTNYLFCFEEEVYYVFADAVEEKFIKPIIHRIDKLFDGFAFEYDSDERLQAIFNYKNEKFVLMTFKNLYIIDYRQIRVDLNDFKIIIYPEMYKIEKYKHFFFNNTFIPNVSTHLPDDNDETIPPDDGVTIVDKTSKSDKDKKTNRLTVLISFAIIVLLTVFTLITLFANQKRKKSDTRIKERKDSKRTHKPSKKHQKKRLRESSVNSQASFQKIKLDSDNKPKNYAYISTTLSSDLQTK
jgi:hypothetical protein